VFIHTLSAADRALGFSIFFNITLVLSGQEPSRLNSFAIPDRAESNESTVCQGHVALASHPSSSSSMDSRPMYDLHLTTVTD
jgi:hypothetical protein